MPLNTSASAQIVGIDQLELSGDLNLRVNNTGLGLNKTITFADNSTVGINFSMTEGNITQVEGTDVKLNIPDVAEING
jgi:hypothetical protein